VWPLFRPQDRVRVRLSGCVGHVNQIDPNERGDDWVFEIIFEGGDVGRYDTGVVELVEVSGLEHDSEIELVLDTSSPNGPIVANDVERLVAQTFAIDSVSHTISDEQVRVEVRPRDHPREAVRALMMRLGSAWLVEDDGWYANVTWASGHFPVAGVYGARIFLRPWRDPRSGERLSGDPVD
jgi:hypothetical protein